MLRITLAALLALTMPATAQVTGTLGPASPVLKRSVTIASDIVRIGDFIDNAGAAAQTPIFRAPDLGATGSIPAERVLDAARAHNVLGVDAGGISEVTVTRASRVVTVKDIEERIAQAIARQRGLKDAGELMVKLDREVRAMHVEPTATAPLQVARLSHDSRSGYFDVVLELPGGATARGLPLRFSGTAVEMVETTMLARPLARGEIVRQSDIVIARKPKAEAGSDIVSAAGQAVGLALRRAIRAGQILRQADLMKPELVQRNESVTLVFELPGIVLTSRGKALDSGAEGDVIAVANVQSKRTVQGTVTGWGTVTVASMTPRLAANMLSSETASPAPSQAPRTE